jgi:hypothetical protein
MQFSARAQATADRGINRRGEELQEREVPLRRRRCGRIPVPRGQIADGSPRPKEALDVDGQRGQIKTGTHPGGARHSASTSPRLREEAAPTAPFAGRCALRAEAGSWRSRGRGASPGPSGPPTPRAPTWTQWPAPRTRLPWPASSRISGGLLASPLTPRHANSGLLRRPRTPAEYLHN